MAYYCDRHIPMVRGKLGPACKRIEVEEGLQGARPDARAPYVALAPYDARDGNCVTA
jgi:hypothetical protein